LLSPRITIETGNARSPIVVPDAPQVTNCESFEPVARLSKEWSNIKLSRAKFEAMPYTNGSQKKTLVPPKKCAIYGSWLIIMAQNITQAIP
jgi:hypothetical protein